MEDDLQPEFDFEILPEHVKFTIFSYFKVPFLAKTAPLVCKSWLKRSQTKSLWKYLKLKWQDTRISMIRNGLHTCNHLVSLTVNASVYGIRGHCSLDETFAIPTLKQLIVELAVIRPALLADFPTRFPSLQCLKFYGCFVEPERQHEFVNLLSTLPNLKEIKLIFAKMNELFNDDFVNTIALTYTQLERLEMMNSKSLSTQCIRNLVNHRRENLEKVKLKGSMISDEEVTFFLDCPKLSSLGLRCASNLTSAAFETLVGLNLRTIDLSSITRFNENISSETLSKYFMHPSSQSLLRISISGFSNFSDDTLRDIAWNCYRLVQLFIGATDLVTNEGLARCGRHMEKLTLIMIRECPNVNRNVVPMLPRTVKIRFLGRQT